MTGVKAEELHGLRGHGSPRRDLTERVSPTCVERDDDGGPLSRIFRSC
jgi:hypothetical protein